MMDFTWGDFAVMFFSAAALFISLKSYLISRDQADRAEKALKNNILLSLFAGFDQASTEVMKNTNLLVTVHGLDENDPDLNNIAYLAILIDSFHHYWGKRYDEDYSKVLEEDTNFIHKIVSIEANYPSTT